MAFERKTLIDFSYRAVVIALLLANFFLRSTFVTKEAYENDKKASDKLLSDMMLIIKTDEVRAQITERHAEALRDHETRLRMLEMKR